MDTEILVAFSMAIMILVAITIFLLLEYRIILKSREKEAEHD